MSQPTAIELQELGLYDPAAADAEQRLELLEYLISTGASVEDLLAHRDGLPGLPFLLAMRGGSALTLQDAVERTGIGEEKLLQFIRAAGTRRARPATQWRVYSCAGPSHSAAIRSNGSSRRAP